MDVRCEHDDANMTGWVRLVCLAWASGVEETDDDEFLAMC